MSNLNTQILEIIFSLLLGVGLATLFQFQCVGTNCIVIKSKIEPEYISNNIYKLTTNNCVVYKPELIDCKK